MSTTPTPMDHVIDPSGSKETQLRQARGWICQLQHSYAEIQKTCANKDAALIAANARVAELEKERVEVPLCSHHAEVWFCDRRFEPGDCWFCSKDKQIAALTRQLSEAQAKLASAEDERDKAVAFSSRIERGDRHFESLCKDQLQGIAEAFKDEKSIHESLFDAVLRCKLRRDALEAQLASAREDSERLSEVEANGWTLRMNCSPIADTGDYSTWWEVIEHHMAKPHERVIGHAPEDKLRSALDSARGASPQDAGKPSAWQPMETASRKGCSMLLLLDDQSVVLGYFHTGRSGNGWREQDAINADVTPVGWQPLPPPPQDGKEQNPDESDPDQWRCGSN